VTGALVRMEDGALVYGQPLVEGTFLRRRKRFFADVRLDDGREVVAHCANTGSMKGTSQPGSRCRVMDVASPKRKLAWSLEQIAADGVWTMIHTGRPNRIVEAAIAAGRVPALTGYSRILREKPYGDGHRIDLRLEADDRRPCLVEVKNVTWVEDGVARFPDAVSTRATAHLDALRAEVQAGFRAVVLLHVARGDAERVAPADDLDPAFGEALRAADAAGVEIMAWDVALCATHVALRRPRPVARTLTEALAAG